MISKFKNSDLYPILEAYRMIYENAEGKNINKAEKFIKQNHPEIIGTRLQNGTTMTPRIFTQEIRNLMPNVRGADCKFLLGVSRIYFEDLAKDQAGFQQKSAQLNKILKLATSDAHVNEYDNNLNGLSLDELNSRFGSAVQQNLQNDMDAIASSEYTRNEEYDIVPIPDYETAMRYGQYTSWCVTHYENMYDNYTNGGMGLFYFCLRKGFEQTPMVRGEGCPMDDYGKSMIAISVNDDGSLNTCTCRWNHDNGGNDSMMNTKEISDFFGVNFYETFKPRDPTETFRKYKEKAVEDDFAERMGWYCVESDEVSYAYDYVMLTNNGNGNGAPRLLKYRKVFRGTSSSYPDVVCVASDRFYWYDARSLNRIDPPDMINGNLECQHWSQLTSLHGCPRSIGDGILDCEGCNNLESVDGIPQELGDLNFLECEKLKPDSLAQLADKPVLVKRLLFGDKSAMNNSEFSMDANGTATALVDFDDIEKVYESGRNDLSWDFIEKLLKGEDFDLFYSDYTPKISEMDSGDFDDIMSRNGIDITWKDISELYSYGEAEDGKFTEDQSDEIIELIDEDFYDGRSIGSFYSDCEMSGTSNNAYNTVKSELFPELYIDEDYGVQDGKVKVVLPRNVIAECFKHFSFDEDWNIFEMLRRDDDYEDTVDFISISEPYGGFSEFDDEEWRRGVDSFAEKIVEIMGRTPKVKDLKGQMFFDFDKDYLDNPRNKPR